MARPGIRVRLISDHRPLILKVNTGYRRAVADVEREADRNLASSRYPAYARWMPSKRARIQTNAPFGLIRQWGGVIRPRNRAGYLTFRTRDGNWVRTKASRQQGTQWLTRACLTFGRHMTDHLRRLG